MLTLHAAYFDRSGPTSRGMMTRGIRGTRHVLCEEAIQLAVQHRYLSLLYQAPAQLRLVSLYSYAMCAVRRRRTYSRLGRAW
jgi:hypothetical protein